MTGPVPAGVAAALAGRWELLGELGRGGMGVVLRARDQSTGTLVALKILLEASSAPPARRERFRREAELAARLDHPGLVRTLAWGEEHGVPWVASELIEGARTLDRVLPELPPRERVALVRDVARALGHAHGRGVVHRDVKPENVLIDALGRARLTDFGLASAADQERLTRTGLQLGTPHYMAPEQVTGEREAHGPATDVWALGVLLYRALADRVPFQADDMLQLSALICDQPPPPLPAEVPPGLQAACLAALEKEPARRPPDGTALAVALERWLQGAALAPAPRRAGVLLGALGVLGLAGLGLAGTAPWLLSPGSAPTRDGADGPAPTPGIEPGPRPGTFVRRLPDGQALALVWVPRAGGGGFWLGEREVTRGQLRACHAALAKGPAPAPEADDSLPAAGVGWAEAEAFCAWAGLRLPTLAEWERASEMAAGPALRLRDDPPEWLQDSLAQHPELAVRRPADAKLPLPKSLHERLVGGPGELRSEAETTRQGGLGFRVAGPAPALRWRVRACGFPPEPRPPRWPGFEGLLALGGPALDLELPALSLRLPNGASLGKLPQVAGTPGADGFPQDFFALRAEATVELDPGRWSVVAQWDDALRLWIDGALRHEVWGAAPGAVQLPFQVATRRPVSLRVDMVEFYVDARLELWLERLE